MFGIVWDVAVCFVDMAAGHGGLIYVQNAARGVVQHGLENWRVCACLLQIMVLPHSRPLAMIGFRPNYMHGLICQHNFVYLNQLGVQRCSAFNKLDVSEEI